MLRNTHSNTLLAMLRQVSLSVNFTSIPEIVRTRYLGILAAGSSVLCCLSPSARSNSLKTVRTLASKTLGTYVSPASRSLSKDVSQRIQNNSRTALVSSLPVLPLRYDSKKRLILPTNLFSSVKLHSHSTRDFQFSFRKCWRVRLSRARLVAILSVQVFDARFWHAPRPTFVPMPKATMHKNHLQFRRKHHVRLAWEVPRGRGGTGIPLHGPVDGLAIPLVSFDRTKLICLLRSSGVRLSTRIGTS